MKVNTQNYSFYTKRKVSRRNQCNRNKQTEIEGETLRVGCSSAFKSAMNAETELLKRLLK